ncbi:hypothetical protein DL766_010313 [Monosporascus sp. MC13-8B]|uniref:Cystathionine gamma-synthase n=1 Tax=Monosporascus cannonballus TaxID=155416 RepID=A0ABY0H0P8_9PEZI|nr:hypothetical protein DL762_008471 [Monosporascus cannonballus]RYO83899.1 hypothetical protein DL763_007671 [Monosporascus cannonballus]RYP02486.1 hypothetical protein DL766_010313 [Monosporascus sp. MC13-8B]
MAGNQSEGDNAAGVSGEPVQNVAHKKPVHGDNSDGPAENGPDQHLSPLSLSARAVHADDYLNSHQAVAPPMHVSTTFQFSRDPEKLEPWLNINPNNPHDSHVYSRDTAPNTTRLEAVLSSLLGGPALTYSSGLAAFHALLVFLNPRRIAIGGGYHGCHGVIRLLSKLTGLRMIEFDPSSPADDDAALERELGPGDVVHVETPLNPTGEARDLERYAAIARRAGAYLVVDATFAPPPLLDPFRWGADAVMHSGTKYLGGHSDMLCGVVAVAPRHNAPDARDGPWIPRLRSERLVLGSVMGSFEGWLGLRSVRTLELRVRRQSADAEALVRWLAGEVSAAAGPAGRVIREVRHASLQAEAADGASWLRRQMPHGFGAVFSVLLRDADSARRLPSKLRLFQHATSLGGVESLVEWRAVTDRSVDPRLLRVSVGVEGWEDLRDDLVRGCEALLAEEEERARSKGEEKEGGEGGKGAERRGEKKGHVPKLSASDVGGSMQIM